MDLIRSARNRLREPSAAKKYYTEKDIPGLGKNYLTEDNRARGVHVYTDILRYAALKGLVTRAETLLEEKRLSPDLLMSDEGDDRWRFERRLIHDELGRKEDPSALLRQYVVYVQTEAKGVESSKSKDDLRGSRIIDHYAFFHKPAFSDEIVRYVWQKCFETEKRIDQLIGQLNSSI